MSRLKRLIREIHERSLWQALVVYLGASFAILEAVDLFIDYFMLPRWLFPIAFALLLIGLPLVVTASLGEEEVYDEDVAVEDLSAAVKEDRRLRFLTWRNAGFAFLGAMALWGIFAAGWVGMRTMGIGPAGTLFAKGVLEERDRIILADFENFTSDTLLGRVVTEAFRTELAQSQAVKVAERDYVGRVLERIAKDPGVPLTYDLAREVAIREGLRAVVAGQVGSVGQGYVLSIRLIAAETGEELVAHGETADGDKALILAIDRLSKWMRERIGESLTTVRGSPPLEQVRTASLEALRLYTEAFEVDWQGYRERALYLLDRAIEIDTAFAAAYAKRAYVRMGLGIERAQMIADATRAYELRHRLPPVERYRAEVEYHWDVTGDVEKVINATLSILKLNPDDLAALNDLGWMYYSRREFARAEGLFRRRIELDSAGAGFVWLNLVRAQFNQGKSDEVEETLRQLERKVPEHLDIGSLRARFASALGDYTASEAHIRDDLAAAPGDLRRQRRAEELRGILAEVQGRLGEAERHYRNAMVSLEQAGQSRAVVWRAVWLGESYLLVRDAPDRAVEVVDSALQRHPLSDIEPVDRPYLGLAQFYAQAGRLERSKELLAEYEAVVEPSLRFFSESSLHKTLGEIALAEGRPLDAVAEFRAYDHTMSDRGHGYPCTICALTPLGRAYEAAGEADSAIAVYERYVTTPWWGKMGSKCWYIYERLADLYEQRGDTTNAIRYYAKFVDLWKDADPELQHRVAAARRAMDALSTDR